MAQDDPGSIPLGSLVIPAHNEAAVIARCLRSVAGQPRSAELEVVVVANGCTDDTVTIARGFESQLPMLTVLDLDEASKAAALNAGDDVATAYPRIYLDADIELGEGTIDQLLAALAGDEPAVAGPTVTFDLSSASRPVRRFYQVYMRLPYVRDGLVGLGVYALNRSGRSRFTRFPSLSADDLFVQRLFAPAERTVVPGTFSVRVPRTLADLIRVRTRIAGGNAEYEAQTDSPPEDGTSSTRETLLGLLRESRREPRLLPSVAIYVYVVVMARRQAGKVGSPTWLRDQSSRPDDAESPRSPAP